MQKVEPIRDAELLKEMKNHLKSCSERDYLLFILGINTGLRISDILSLQVKDVKNKDYIQLREKKTNKYRRIFVNQNIKDDLNKFVKNKPDDDYIFRSRLKANKPIDRGMAYKILNNSAKIVGINDNIGTHTLRKTFGYHHYKQYKDIATLQAILNHSHPVITLSYIGTTADTIDNSIANLII